MAIEKETREMFMGLPTWNARDALRMLLEIDPDSISLADDFDGSEIEVEARALIGWLYRYGLLPRAIREPYDAAPELIADYLDAIGEVRRTPAEWIAAAAANPAAPAEWLESLLALSDAPEKNKQRDSDTETSKALRTGHDITTERGCRRQILEIWDTVLQLHGASADARQVLRIIECAFRGT